MKCQHTLIIFTTIEKCDNDALYHTRNQHFCILHMPENMMWVTICDYLSDQCTMIARYLEVWAETNWGVSFEITNMEIVKFKCQCAGFSESTRGYSLLKEMSWMEENYTEFLMEIAQIAVAYLNSHI